MSVLLIHVFLHQRYRMKLFSMFLSPLSVYCVPERVSVTTWLMSTIPLSDHEEDFCHDRLIVGKGTDCGMKWATGTDSMDVENGPEQTISYPQHQRHWSVVLRPAPALFHRQGSSASTTDMGNTWMSAQIREEHVM